MGIDLYMNHRRGIMTGDAIQWKSFTPLGWAIRLFSKPPKDKRHLPWYTANHTSLAITFHEYDQDRRYTTEALKYGIDLNLLSRRIMEYNGEIYQLPLKIEFNHCRKNIGRIALSHMGIGYDYRSLFRQTFFRVKPNRRELFCSEHYFISIREAFRIDNLDLFSSIVKAPRPCDIPDLGIFGEPIRIK